VLQQQTQTVELCKFIDITTFLKKIVVDVSPTAAVFFGTTVRQLLLWVAGRMLEYADFLGCILDARLAGQCCNTVFLFKCGHALFALKSLSPLSAFV